MLLSAVSVWVVAQSSSEIPEGLMNNPVLRYCKPKEEALDRPLWRTRFGSGYGPAVRQIMWWLWWWYQQQHAIFAVDHRTDWLLVVFDFVRSWKSFIQSRVRLLWISKIHCCIHKSLVKFCTPRGRAESYARLEIRREVSLVRREQQE